MNTGILVADSGSTKTDWLLVRADGSQTELHTGGINPARDARDIIYNVVCHELLTQLPLCSTLNKGEDESPHNKGTEELAVYFYGAGCIEPFSQTVKGVAVTTQASPAFWERAQTVASTTAKTS